MGHRAKARNVAGWVLLLPFLLLSLIPPGVMPDRAADGTMLLVLCTGDGPVEMLVDLATGEPVGKTPDGSDDKSNHCAWACGQMTMAGLSAPALPLAGQSPRRADAPPPLLLLALAHATGLPPATGPPITV